MTTLTPTTPAAINPGLPLMIDVASLSREEVGNLFGDSCDELRNYEPPYIKDALREMRPEGYVREDDIPPLELGAKFYFSNFCVPLINYSYIDVMLRLMFPGRKKIAGLQLGANYGPYLHYLKYGRGIEGVRGAEIDELPVGYAQRHGVPVDRADAAKLPHPDSSLELIISRHLLCPGYFTGSDGNVTMWRIASEISRCLKSGGVLLSDDEKSFMDDCAYQDIFLGMMRLSSKVRHDSLRVWYKP